MAENNLQDEVRNLKKNLAFQMSLSGKELFHSNMIATFLQQTDEDGKPTELAKKVMKFFPPTDYSEENTRVFDVLREKENLDIVIIYCIEDQKKDLEKKKCFCYDDISFKTKEKKETSDDDAADTEQEDTEQEDANKEDGNSEITTEQKDENLEITTEQEDDRNLKIAELINKFQYVIIENKFKSFPYDEQLKKYSEKKLSIFKVDDETKKRLGYKKQNIDVFRKGYFKCYLLAPQQSLDIYYGTKDGKKVEKKFTNGKNEKSIDVCWEQKSYEDYEKILEEYCNSVNAEHSESLMDKFVKEYSEFLNTMLDFYDKQIVEGIVENKEKKKCFLTKEQDDIFLSARIQDFYEKILFNQILAKLRNDDVVPKNSLEFIKDGEKDAEPFFYSKAEYSRQHGLLDFRYAWPNNNINAGIQIQNNRFEIVICAELGLYEKNMDKEVYEKYKPRFKETFDEFHEEIKAYSENFKEYNDPKKSVEWKNDNEIAKSWIKWIKDVFDKIMEEWNAKHPEPKQQMKENFLVFKTSKKANADENAIDMYGYTTAKYVFRYAYIDLNKFVLNKFVGENETYRDISYEDLRDLLGISLKAIKEILYEKPESKKVTESK